MQDIDPFPIKVDVDRARQVMEIGWEDGHTSSYSGEQLRWACPCAECRGEAGSPGRLASLNRLSSEELRIKDVALIGQYALQIGFESGHATGLYTFRLLRQLERGGSPPGNPI
ncbi:MAG: gamma-butyrobetaine hydroxylase-like domain-containing protein [Candidatus Dormibacterales bacterium]